MRWTPTQEDLREGRIALGDAITDMVLRAGSGSDTQIIRSVRDSRGQQVELKLHSRPAPGRSIRYVVEVVGWDIEVELGTGYKAAKAAAQEILDAVVIR